MRVVELHHAGRHLAQHAGEGPGGRGPQVAAERDLAHLEAGLARPRRERAAAPAGEHDLVPAGRHRPRGQEHLVLSAAPAGRGVDVHHPHPDGVVRARSISFASFAYV